MSASPREIDGASTTRPPQIVFACRKNAGRSLASRVLAEHYAGERVVGELDAHVRALLVELVPDFRLPPSVFDPPL